MTTVGAQYLETFAKRLTNMSVSLEVNNNNNKSEDLGKILAKVDKQSKFSKSTLLSVVLW